MNIYYRLFSTVFISFIFLNVNSARAMDSMVVFEAMPGDMTLSVRKTLENYQGKRIHIKFLPGEYFFKADFAKQKYCYISNHDNGLKNIIFPFERFEEVIIEGNGAELVFHGQILPFLFENCQNVSVNDLVLDWDLPFCFQSKVIAVNELEGYYDIVPYREGFPWEYKKGKIKFPGINGFNYSVLGTTLSFDEKHKRVSHGALDLYSNPERILKLENGAFRIYENLRQWPKPGAILNSKGPKGENRYAPAIHVKSSYEIKFDHVVIHHALGMGFLCERSENISLSGCGVYVRDGSERVVSITADATHFCNCKGDILIEDCRFEHMLDDGTNVHGTYVTIDEVIDDYTIRAKLEHYQQLGFEFAATGDSIWFLHKPSHERQSTGVVKESRQFNDRYFELQFEETLPEQVGKGDILENKTWNPTFTMRGCSIKDHRARNIVLKTPKKILIENNDFSSMMSSIFFRGETYYWFESGGVTDVLIKNNRFVYCAYSGMEHAILNITPNLNRKFLQDELYDRNIRFIDNEIKTFDSRIIWADRVSGLEIRGNNIEIIASAPKLHPDAPVFEFNNCEKIAIRENIYNGDLFNVLKLDDRSSQSIEIENNVGF